MNNVKDFILQLLELSVELDGCKNAVVICDINNNILSVGYNGFVYGKGRKFSETYNKNFKEKGDRYYIVDAFTKALMNLIDNNQKNIFSELVIHTTNLPNAQATKILTYFNVIKIVNYNISPFTIFPEITENYDIETNSKNRVINLIAKEKNIIIEDYNRDCFTKNNYLEFDKYIKNQKINNKKVNIDFENELLNHFPQMLSLLDNFSDDKYFQVSACLVDRDFRIINCSTNTIPRNSKKTKFKIDKKRKRKFILCAEQILIMDSIFKNINLIDKILITNAMPCYMCAKMIVEFGIKNIIIFDFEKFKKIDFTDEISEDIFINAGVNYKIIKKIKK